MLNEMGINVVESEEADSETARRKRTTMTPAAISSRFPRKPSPRPRNPSRRTHR